MSALSLGLVFKSWNYVTTSITFDPAALLSLTDPDGLVWLDIGYGIILVDRNWLAKKLPSWKISTMPVFLKVKGIGALKHKSTDSAPITIYILGIKKKSHEVYAAISCKLHLVNAFEGKYAGE